MDTTATRPNDKSKLYRRFSDTRKTWLACLVSPTVDAESRERARAKLFKTYRPPILAFILTDLKVPEQDAQDLTNDFFLKAQEKGFFEGYDPTKGKLRNYICITVKNIVRDWARREKAAKRGAGMERISIDHDNVLERLESNERPPDEAFALRLIFSMRRSVVHELRQDYREQGNLHIFEAMLPYLNSWERQAEPQEEVARAVNLSVQAFRMRLNRGREFIHDTVKARILEMVGSEREANEEMAYLLRVISKY